ncbi:MAG TPA: complex I subunit 1 family protein, partial [Anaerolineaceae bacterium]|nr:complex I subunit 1 family protein [Anaerolineaceae bacterium]
LGWLFLWITRKLMARLQARKGPPFYQPFFDFIKLMGKETLVPGGTNRVIFYALPLVALVSMIFALALIPVPGSPLGSFNGSLILLIYLLEMPALCDILAGFVTRSLYAQVGATREATLSLGYNLPFLISLIALAVHANSTNLQEILSAAPGPALIFISLAMLLSVPARLKSNPFSIANAESEIVAGIHTEYNGKPLAIFELVHGLELTALAGLFAILFLPFAHNLVSAWVIYVLCALGLVFLTTGLAAATARLKIQHAFSFFWSWGAAVAVLAIIVAVVA